MNIVLINFSGNVGKSTLTQHLFTPRLPNVTVIPIESINSDGKHGDDNIRGRAFDELMERMLLAENSIVDIGASNVEDFIKQVKKHAGSHHEFDAFIVPTVPDQKQQIDTWQTISQLNEMGVPPQKIRLIFNKVDTDEKMEKTFDYLLSQHQRMPFCQLDLNWSITENELFSKIQSTTLSIMELANDPTDYRALVTEAKDREDKIINIKKLGDQRLSIGVNRQFDTLFHSLNLDAKDE